MSEDPDDWRERIVGLLRKFTSFGPPLGRGAGTATPREARDIGAENTSTRSEVC